MSTTSFIRRHIHKLAAGELFTTRDLLIYGRRAAVDQAVFRMVHSGYIQRLARGVFMKPGCPDRQVSLLEIAHIKARSFGKQIISHAADVAAKLGLIDKGNCGPAFAISGRSSCFHFDGLAIHFKGVSPRQMKLGESRAGEALRALCHLGPRASNDGILDRATRKFGRTDRQFTRRSAALIPWWLADCFVTDTYIQPSFVSSR